MKNTSINWPVTAPWTYFYLEDSGQILLEIPKRIAQTAQTDTHTHKKNVSGEVQQEWERHWGENHIAPPAEHSIHEGAS